MIDCIYQTQTKVAPVRDFALDRHQNRAAGRQSSGPDPRRASLASFAESDNKSRESTPRLGSQGGPSAPPVRKPRMFPRHYLLIRIKPDRFFSRTSQPC